MGGKGRREREEEKGRRERERRERDGGLVWSRHPELRAWRCRRLDLASSPRVSKTPNEGARTNCSIHPFRSNTVVKT